MGSTKDSNTEQKRPKEGGDDGAKHPKRAKTAASTKLVKPLVPTDDPCSSSYDISANPFSGKATWVLYLAVREPPRFAAALERCQALAQSNDLKQRLQLAGTRHVTLWDGALTQDEARKLEMTLAQSSTLPLSISFQSWIPQGGYLKLDAKSQTALKGMVQSIQHLPKGKITCDHLSLYRARGMNFGQCNRECSKIRNGVPASDFGPVEGVSIRLKVMGSDYGHCRVLAGEGAPTTTAPSAEEIRAKRLERFNTAGNSSAVAAAKPDNDDSDHGSRASDEQYT